MPPSHHSFFIILPPCAIFGINTELHVHQFTHTGQTFLQVKFPLLKNLFCLKKLFFLQEEFYSLFFYLPYLGKGGGGIYLCLGHLRGTAVLKSILLRFQLLQKRTQVLYERSNFLYFCILYFQIMGLAFVFQCFIVSLLIMHLIYF